MLDWILGLQFNMYATTHISSIWKDRDFESRPAIYII